MGFFDLFKKKAKEEVTQAVDKVQDMPKQELVDNAAEALKKLTPDSIDKVIDQAADKVNEKVS